MGRSSHYLDGALVHPCTQSSSSELQVLVKGGKKLFSNINRTKIGTIVNNCHGLDGVLIECLHRQQDMQD